MAPVTIVTDSTQYLPRAVIERRGIQIVSLYVSWNGRTDRESDFDDFDAFYDFLRSGGELPTTSQPSVGDFLAVYEPLVERGDDILSIHISGGISGTVGAAEQARDALIENGMAAERMIVMDSRTGAQGHGFVALAADNAVRAGGGLAEAVAAARAMREDTYILMAIDTLEFLRRGGRIGAAQAWIGATLKVKPILTIDGEMKPVERVRTAGRAFERLVDHLVARKESGCDAFAVAHTNARETAERLAERGREIYGRDPEVFSEIGPVIGTHTGPGLLGVAGLRTDLLGPV
jgi:fatty acid kinase fatty acid binding subunit